MRRVVARYAVTGAVACLVGGMLGVVAAATPALAAKPQVNAVTFKVSNADIFDNGYNQSFTSVLTATETGGGMPNIPTISGVVPGSGFTCGAPTTSTATTASCTIEAAPGPSNGDDSGVIGANGTSNTVSVADTDNSNENGTGIPYSGTETMIIYPAPICGASGVNPFTGVAGTAGALIAPADTTYGNPAVAESCYNGASGPPSALLTNVNSAGGTIFMGSNAIDAAGGTALTIMAGPGFNWTGSVGSGEADVDTGTAGLSKQAWSSATVTLVTVTGGSPNVSTTGSSVPALFPVDVADAGVTVSGTDIPAGTTVLSGQGTGTVMLSQNASATPAGPETLTFTWASTASPPPSAYMTSSSTVASEAAFKSSGDPINTCPPQQALIDAGLPFCFEEFETTGSGPSAAQVAVEYAGQNLPSAQTPTVALSQASGAVGSSIGITDQSGQCPASIGYGTPYSFSSTYSCWYGRAGDATPVTVTVGGVPATVTPTNALVGDVSEADYTVGTSSTVTNVDVTNSSNQISTTTSPSTPGSVPATFAGLAGYGVSGTGIPVGTTVTSVNGTTAMLSSAATANGTSTVTKVVLVSGMNTVNVSGTSVPANFYPALVGSVVTGTDIMAGTTVLSETPTQLTLSTNVTGSVPAGETLTFNPGPETVTFYPVNLDPPQLNASFIVGAGTPTGTQTVEVCETTTPENGNDWEFGVQWMATGGSLGYVSGSSGPTQVCSSTTMDVLVTAATSTTSTPTSSTIVLGNPNTDGAVVTGNATLGSPTGSVSFYQCGPTATPQPCTSQSNQVGSAVGLTAGAGDTSSATSTSFTPTSTGYWCFGASYSGDANYSASSDTSTDECFDVTAASTMTTTTPSASSIVLGNSATDGAVVTGNSAGGSPTGSVSFYECGPTPGPQVCASQTNQVGSAVGVTGGAGNTSSATSTSFTPTSTGYWCFAGYYSGDSNYSASFDTSTDECFDVTAASSATVSTPGSSSIVLGNGNTDSAVVTGNAAGGSPTGSVTFYQCGPTATPQPCTSQSNQVGSAVGLTAGAGNTSSATSTSELFPGATGYFCFGAYYSGDSNYSASSDTSIGECFDVAALGSSTTSTPTHSSIVLGNTNTDGAVVTGNATGGSPTGTVTFYECGPTASPQSCTSQANQLGSPVAVTAGAGNTSSANSVTFTPHAGGYYCFGAYFSGDSYYAASSDTSTDECFDVTKASSTTTSLPGSGRIAIGGMNSDNVTVAGITDGGAPTGTVKFYECGPTANSMSCTSQLNQVGSTVTLTPGPGDVSYASSASIVFADEGTYCFGAYYSGNSNYSASSDTTVTECFVVGAAPTITSFTPTHGAPGTTVTITGTNLSGALSVKIGSTAATITHNTATKIKITVPAGAHTGKIKVVTMAGSVTSSTKFTVT